MERPPPPAPRPRQRQLNGDEGGEELTRQAGVRGAQRRGGEEGLAGRTACTRPPHQEGAWHVPGTERSQGSPVQQARGEGRQRKPAKSRAPESSGLSVCLLPGSLSL